MEPHGRPTAVQGDDRLRPAPTLAASSPLRRWNTSIARPRAAAAGHTDPESPAFETRGAPKAGFGKEMIRRCGVAGSIDPSRESNYCLRETT